MQITLNITEDSKVELVKDNCELVQGECCFTDFVFNFPSTIKGYSIDEYIKTIEFAECKELGECVKFVDIIEGNKYELNEACTAFKKIMAQVVLERNADNHKITWKTIPFSLEFVESVNAEGSPIIQAQLLSLAEIQSKWQSEFDATKNEWEDFVKANTLRIIYGDMPTADASTYGDTVFYLGANTDLLTYGHYYRCNIVGGIYVWTDLTKDASLVEVANGIREINHNQTLQVWKGTTDELEAVTPEENVGYIVEDREIEDTFDEVLTVMAEGGKIAYPIKENENRVIEYCPKVKVKIGGQNSRDESVNSGCYEFYPLNSGLTVGDTFTYGGETVTIDGEEGNYYEVYCKLDGEIAAASASEIFVETETGKTIIPHKKLVWSGAHEIKHEEYSFLNVGSIAQLCGAKSLEFVFDWAKQTHYVKISNNVENEFDICPVISAGFSDMLVFALISIDNVSEGSTGGVEYSNNSIRLIHQRKKLLFTSADEIVKFHTGAFSGDTLILKAIYEIIE